MNTKAMNFVLVGVGGQGTILASDVLAELGLRLGFDVKKAEVHGMSQRGGSVVSHLRWAPQVFAPVIPPGGADVLLAFEKLEAARSIDWVSPDGLVVLNDYAIEPVTVNLGGIPYPTDDQIQAVLSQRCKRVTWVKGHQIAEGLGNPRAANTVLLGALAGLLKIDPANVKAVLEARLPLRHLEINLRALDAGFRSIKN